MAASTETVVLGLWAVPLKLKLNLHWTCRVKGMVFKLKSISFFVKKSCQEAESIVNMTRAMIQNKYQHIRVIEEKGEVADLVVTVGGDGTMLHAASHYPNKSPVFLPLSKGTLGFMLPFCISLFQFRFGLFTHYL